MSERLTKEDRAFRSAAVREDTERKCLHSTLLGEWLLGALVECDALERERDEARAVADALLENIVHAVPLPAELPDYWVWEQADDDE